MHWQNLVSVRFVIITEFTFESHRVSPLTRCSQNSIVVMFLLISQRCKPRNGVSRTARRPGAGHVPAYCGARDSQHLAQVDLEVRLRIRTCSDSRSVTACILLGIASCGTREAQGLKEEERLGAEHRLCRAGIQHVPDGENAPVASRSGKIPRWNGVAILRSVAAEAEHSRKRLGKS